MIIVDILCIYSCLALVFSYRAHKKVYYVLKGDGRIDRLAIGLLSRFGWEFALLEYELKPVDARTPFLDIQSDLRAMVEEHLRPVIRKQVNSCNFLLQYEKEHLSAYLTFAERQNLYRSVEISHVCGLLKDQIGKPEGILLHGSRWKHIIAAGYKAKGYKAGFYKIHFPFKLKKRKDYIWDKLAENAVRSSTFFDFSVMLYKIVANIFHCVRFGISRHMRKGVPRTLGEFDICAIVPGYGRTEQFNDMHWKKMQKGKECRTLAILYGTLDNSAYDDYGYLAESWISLSTLSASSYLFSAFYWLWPVYPKILFCNLGRLLRGMFKSDVPWEFRMKIMRLFVEISKLEAIFKLTGSKLLWSSIEGNHPEAMTAAMAINRVGGVSAGSTWSAHSYPGLSSERLTNDILFLWGSRHTKIILHGGALFKSLITAGYPGDHHLEYYTNKANMLRDKWKRAHGNKSIMCFYNNISVKDDVNIFSDMATYMDRLTAWTMENKNVLLVIKLKREKKHSTYALLDAELFKKLESQGRLIYEFEKADLSPGLASDIVLGTGFATLPCLLGTYGKRVILFDPNKLGDKWAMGVGNVQFIQRPEDITGMLDSWIKEVHEDSEKKWKIKILPAPNKLDSFTDGRSVERITAYTLNLVKDLKQGLNSDEAIRRANISYQEQWGPDKIYEKI